MIDVPIDVVTLSARDSPLPRAIARPPPAAATAAGARLDRASSESTDGRTTRSSGETIAHVTRVRLSRARRDGGRVRASVCRRARSRGKLPETPARAARGRGPFGLLGLLRDYDYGDGRGVSTNESAAWVGTAKARATPARRGRRESTGAREARLAASTLDANLFEDETSRPAR